MVDKRLNILGIDKNSIKALLFLHTLDKTMIPLSILQSILSTAFPFVEIYFIARIIDLVLSGKLNELIPFIAMLIISNLVLGIFIDFVKTINQYKANKMEKKMIGVIQEKVMEIDFEMMEDPHMLKKISDAKYAMEYMGGYYSFIMYYIQLLESSLRVVTSISVIIGMCFSVSIRGNPFVDFIASFPVSIGLLTGPTVINLYLSASMAKKMKRNDSEVFKQKTTVERRLNYFTDKVFLNYSTGKDIRIFHMSDLLIHYHHKNMKIAKDFYQKYYVDKQINYDTLSQFSDSILSFFSYIIVIFKMLSEAITIGELSGYIGVISLFHASLVDIVKIRQKIKLQNEFTMAFYELLHMESKANMGLTKKYSIKNVELAGFQFEFHHVSFKYNNSEQYTLKNISCKIHDRKKIAIVGKNGAGKTTLIKLLCRLYEPTEGYITLNGIDIREYDYHEYIDFISVVFQDYRLFALPIRENIAASKNPEDKKVLQSLKLSGLADKIEKLPNGLETNLYHYDEDGIEISGGEAQKIAIARAIYKDSPTIILDEPTSALDPASEYEIYQKFGALTQNKTTIYISHRMSSCIFCDHIIVVDKGEIIQQGSHDELLYDKENLYAKLYNAQAKYFTQGD